MRGIPGSKTPHTVENQSRSRMRARGSLRTYLGTAPGVGKTYAMLAEGRRREERGERVVIGWVERKGREATRRQRGDLEIIAPHEVLYRGVAFSELDIEEVISSGADVVLIDELAHRWPDGSRRRLDDVGAVLDAGIDVMTTLNVASLESVRAYAAQLTGVGSTESVPDDFVRSGEIVLVDLPADMLRRRIASGAVFSAADVGGALAEFFKVSNLEALSTLAVAWMDDELDRVGQELLVTRGLSTPSDPPLVLAGDSGSEWGKWVIQRAAELARDADADLLVVHVAHFVSPRPLHPGGRVGESSELTAEFGGRYVERMADDAVDELVRIAEAKHAAIVVVGHHRSWFGELIHGSVLARLRRRLPYVEVVEVTGPPVLAGEDGLEASLDAEAGAA
jgi:two-component system, OmpR family, sensor histidine kinase KdpD